MVETRMHGTWINEKRKPHLDNPPQTLKIRMTDDIVRQFGRQLDKAPNRIVYYFVFIHTHLYTTARTAKTASQCETTGGHIELPASLQR